MLAIQYLEDSPDLARLDQKRVINKLRAAAECLPFTHLLIGWHVPVPMLEACRIEADRLAIRFLRWQPLLTTDKHLEPDPTWYMEGLTGRKVAGYRGLPEFTFYCPNHPAMREAMYDHLDKLVRQGLYQGFFLDRVRFPSPSMHPINDLTCFCKHCQNKAALFDVDLEGIRQKILQSTHEEKGRMALVKTLLTGKPELEQAAQSSKLGQFLAFRERCVRDYLAFVSQPIKEARLEIGLDCYSPSLTHLVGQDLNTMGELVDWIKLMTYAHTLAPAGLPFELSGLLHYLLSTTHLTEEQAFSYMRESTRLPLPLSINTLEKDGLSALALEEEVKRGVDASSAPILAGIELVDLEGVTHLNHDQIREDLTAVKRAGPAGLAISWDLLHIPLNRLALVGKVYLDKN